MEISGDATKARFIAAFIDNLLAIAFTLLCVGLVPENLSVVKGVALVGVYLGYFLIFEALWARTPGKYFQGLVVRHLDGRPCSLVGAAIRSVLRIIEVNPVLFGALPAGLIVISTDRKQRLGDILAGTIVVSDQLRWDSN